MGRIFKVGNDYFIEFLARGLPYQKKCGPDRAVAQQMLKDIEAEIAHGETGTYVRDISMQDFVKLFHRYAQKNFSVKTVERFKNSIANFIEFLAKHYPNVNNLSQVTPKVIEDFAQVLREAKQIKAKAVNFQLMCIREFLEYGITTAYINDNPTLHVKFLPSAGQRKIQLLNEAEVKALLKMSNEFQSLIIEVILMTGIRIEELNNFKMADINLQKCVLKIKSYKGRNQEQNLRSIPVAVDNMKKLEELRKKLQTIEIEEDVIRENIDILLSQAGIKGKSFNILRHTAAKHFIDRGVGLVRLHQILGIDDIVQVMVYAPFVNFNRV